MSAIAIAGVSAGIGALYGLAYLGHRFEHRFDTLLNRWWGVPTILLGGPALVLCAALAAGAIVSKVVS